MLAKMMCSCPNYTQSERYIQVPPCLAGNILVFDDVGESGFYTLPLQEWRAQRGETREMSNLDGLHELAPRLERLLRLQSLPIALKMLREEGEIPDTAQRPVRDMGHHLSFCQALALTRRRGLTIAETTEDMWCFEPVIGLGFEEPPPRFLKGHNRYPSSAATREAGATWARNMPRFEPGEYSAVVMAPVESAGFMPDLVILYGSPAVMTQIMLAKNWLDGEDIATRLSGHAACVYYVVPALQSGTWRMSIPCGGDLRRAASDDYSMVLSVPAGALEDLVRGVEAIQKTGNGLPSSPNFAIEYPLEEAYVELGREIGMSWLR